MGKRIKALPIPMPQAHGFGHVQIRGIQKAKQGKKRKHAKYLIMLAVQKKFDEQAQIGLNKESMFAALKNRAEFYRAKYGKPVYASNGVDIVSI